MHPYPNGHTHPAFMSCGLPCPKFTPTADPPPRPLRRLAFSRKLGAELAERCGIDPNKATTWEVAESDGDEVRLRFTVLGALPAAAFAEIFNRHRDSQTGGQ